VIVIHLCIHYHRNYRTHGHHYNISQVCKDGLTSSFIELLHESGLAYPLYDPCGQSVGMSLIIAMLPVRPDGHPISDVTEVCIHEYVYIYIHIYVYMYIYIYVYILHMYAHVFNIYMYVYIYVGELA
jgi:hypothetical protein